MGWQTLEQRREYAKKYRNRRRQMDKLYYQNNHSKILQEQKQYRQLPHSKERIRKYEQSPQRKLQHQEYLIKAGLCDNWTINAWAKKIREKFNNKCQICFQKADDVHHILYQRLYPKLRFNPNNGIPLCKKCHWETHGKRI